MHGAKVALLGVVLVGNLYGVAERRIRLRGRSHLHFDDPQEI